MPTVASASLSGNACALPALFNRVLEIRILRWPTLSLTQNLARTSLPATSLMQMSRFNIGNAVIRKPAMKGVSILGRYSNRAIAMMLASQKRRSECDVDVDVDVRAWWKADAVSIHFIRPLLSTRSV